MHKASPQAKWLPVFFYLLLAFVLVAGVVPQSVLADAGSPYGPTFTDASGHRIGVMYFPLPPPPPEKNAAAASMSSLFMAGEGAVILPDVPAFDWVYGCSATAAAMLFGYYDRTGYDNMYTGPANGGVCPIDNSLFWGAGESPLSATHYNIDGRTEKGHVDDYWINSGSISDPYIGHWAEHIQGDCTADYMGTNQWKYDNPLSGDPDIDVDHNVDGSTAFYYVPSGDPLDDFSEYETNEPPERDGCHGMKLFAESRGYTVLANFYQLILGAEGTVPGKGFSFENFQAEIDAGRPVLLQLFNKDIGVGHTMLGFGYDLAGNTICVHDTWDHLDHWMSWEDGDYRYTEGVYLHLTAVTVIHLAPVTTSPADNITETSAILHGDLASLGGYSTANVSFDWGTASDNLAHTTDNQTMDDTGTFSDNLTGLTSGITYYFRAKATGSFGTVTGNTARFTTLIGLSAITVTPSNPEIPMGAMQQFNAMGTYSDNTTADITSLVTWSSNNTTVATIDDVGLALGLVEGATTITAALGPVSDTAILTIIRVLDFITVTPSPTVPAGLAQQFTANGTYSDLSTDNLTLSVTWSSSSITIATIDSSGLATTYIEGTTVISAALGSVSGNTTLIVGPHVLDSVAVTPVDPKVSFISGSPQTLQFNATASYSDGPIDITGAADWISDNVTVATIDAAGLATILSKGKAIISATYGGETANSTLEVSLPVSTTENGGGGGGGGGPSGVTSLAEYITSDGTFVANATAESMDGKVKLTIPKGTIGRNRAGQRLYSVSIKESQTPPAPPADCHYICLVYDFGPGGATFEPPASLTFQYSDAQVPAGVSEENIKLATWQDGVWVEMEGCVIDIVNNTITVPVSHFSTYTVIAYTSPAKLEVSGMTVTPGEVYPGETVTVSAVVANAGDLAGSFTVTLEMNGAAVQTEEVALDGHQSQAVNFAVNSDKAGEYTLDINGLSYIFKVKERVSQNKPEELPVPTPASFSVSDFSVAPAEIYPSGQVTVAVRIVNIGESDGTYTAVLSIDGLEEAQKEVTVKASISETLTFVVSRDKPGTYSVVIGSHTVQFKVIEKILPTPPVTMVIMGSEPAPERVRGWTVGFAAGGVVVTAMAFYLTGWWRKRGAREKLS